MKRQPTEWEKIFTNDMTNKGLISNIYKQFVELNIKKAKRASLMVQWLRVRSYSAEDTGLIPGQERSHMPQCN